MASIKAMQFEKRLLAASSKCKDLINRSLSNDLNAKQDLLIAVNDLWDEGHKEARHLRKALAFLHQAQNQRDEYIETLKKLLLDAGIYVPEPPPVEPRDDRG